MKIVVRLPESIRADIEGLELLPVPVPPSARPASFDLATAFHAPGLAEFAPLGSLARVRLEEGPNQVSRENGKRRVVAQANVRGVRVGLQRPLTAPRDRAASSFSMRRSGISQIAATSA